jgi:hypothetical protein
LKGGNFLIFFKNFTFLKEVIILYLKILEKENIL